jgi:serine/threonine protein kinase
MTPAPETPPIISGLELIEPLGSGGYSDVYLYEQQMPRRKVAVKVLRNIGLTDTLRRQFTAEANAMAELADHPSIVPVFSADVADDGRPYLVMMYYPRENLGVRASHERFAVSEVLRIGIQVSSAVETAHRAGILHRDVKPANILTSQYGTVGLADFGIAAQVAAVDDDDDTGVSVPWSPPEVLYATAPASVQSDVYSLGATLWNLLVGRSPFEVGGDGDNSAFALMRRAKESPVPSTGRADVPSSLERLLSQAMAKDPASRPSTALEFARSLQAVEREQRLPRTEIVVLDDHEPAPRREDPTIDPGATRMRAPVRIDAQPTNAPSQSAERVDFRPPTVPVEPQPSPIEAKSKAPSTSAPADSSRFDAAEPPTVNRPKVVASSSQAHSKAEKSGPTVRRAVAATKVDLGDDRDLDEVGPESSRSKTAVIAIVVAVAALLIVGVGVMATSGGAKKSDSSALVSPIDNTNPDAVGPPGSPTVTGTQIDPATAEYKWTYSNPLGSDTFTWQFADGSTGGSSTTPKVDVANPARTKQCVQVKVRRADGTNAALSWSTPGCVNG